jgi:hypothetical protein
MRAPRTASRPRALGLLASGGPILLAFGLALATFLVHDVGYVLRTPYWVDEAWVAVQDRYPLGDVRQLTSSTPIGWSLLQRWVPGSGPQRGRMLPLVFAAGAVAAAYWLAGSLPWPNRGWSLLAGTGAATATLFAPSLLVRDDLKQYTADVCLTLLVLGLLSRYERRPTRARLTELGALAVLGMLFSAVSAFVAVAAFCAALLVAVLRRARREGLEVVLVGAGTAVGLGAVYEGFYAQSVVPGLTNYWQAYYVPHGWDGFQFTFDRIRTTADGLGLGPAWSATILVGLGLITILRLGRPVLAATIVLLWAEMFLLAALSRYPFLDARTSTFLTVSAETVAVVGVVGLCTLLGRRVAVLTVPLCLVAGGFYIAGVSGDINSHPIPTEDVRSQADYVAAHRRPGDIVLVNLSSNWGFGYYWPADAPQRRRNSIVVQGYIVSYPDSTGIIVAIDRTLPAIQTALDSALAAARADHGRIWLVRSHVVNLEPRWWVQALAADNLTPVPVAGAGELTLINP